MKKNIIEVATNFKFIKEKIMCNKFYQILLFGMSIILFASCDSKKEIADASGTFEATEIIVSSETVGNIVSLNISEGEILQKDQIVGLIDTVQLYLKKLQLEASLKTAVSRKPNIHKQIAAIEHQIETAKFEKKRIENLALTNAVNQKQLDDINANIALLEKQLIAQKSSLEITNEVIEGESRGIKIQIDQIKDQLQKCKITSPITGTILVQYSQAGELATVGKPLFKIANTDEIFLRAYVTSSQLTQIQLNQKVKIFADFGENETKHYEGRVKWISSKSEFTPKTIQTRDERANLVYAIKVAVKNDGYLKIGMYGSLIFSN